jgi:formylglycine-generating enzyme required for sulfatase activity
MAGNVWEWVADHYGAYGPDAVTDPAGPESGDRRVIRGGGWTSEDAVELRAAGRAAMAPEERVSDVGFRCVWGLE